MADSCLKTQLLWGIPCPEGLFENDQLKLLSFIKASMEDDCLSIRLRWMENEFGEGVETEEILKHSSWDIEAIAKWEYYHYYRTTQREKTHSENTLTKEKLSWLLECVKTATNWEHHNYRFHLNKHAISNLLYLKNAESIEIVKNILKEISKNKTTSQDIWDSLITYDLSIQDQNSSLSILTELLSICAEAGAQLTDEQLDNILSRVKVYTRNSEGAEPYFKILVSSNKEKNRLDKNVLSFLTEFYQVPTELVQLAKELVQSMYNTRDECVSSRQLINCFLFITNEQEMINDEVIELFDCDNWLRRSPLHLAVIFLDSLKLLSHNMIVKYIDARDVHGCTPLHLACLHQNEQAEKILKDYVKDGNSTDHFGVTPKDLPSSIGDEIKKKYYEDCCKVLEAKTEVVELLKTMIVMPEDEAKALSNELQLLFERLIREIKFTEAEIQIAGSMREKTKSGILDEADIQILLNENMFGSENKEKHNDFMKELSFALIGALPKISWKDIPLRPIDVSGPWKLIREGKYRRMEISLDVVLVLNCEMNKKRNTFYEKIRKYQQEIIHGGKLQKWQIFQTLEPWNKIKELKMTMCATEWEIIDCLPMPCRLAIVIIKAIVQAYDLVRGNRSMDIKEPISSYTIKTAIFYLLAYDEPFLYPTIYAKALKGALEKVKGKKQRNDKDDGNDEHGGNDEDDDYGENREDDDHGEDLEGDDYGEDREDDDYGEDREDDDQNLEDGLEKVKGEKPRLEKLQFSPNAISKWVKKEDLQEHKQEARVWARDIFLLIKCLAEKNMRLTSFWDRRYPCVGCQLEQSEYTIKLCECALEKLTKSAF